jgi:hypothetical protein
MQYSKEQIHSYFTHTQMLAINMCEKHQIQIDGGWEGD